MGDATVMELVEPFRMSQPAISRHPKVLERAGLNHAGPRCAAPAMPAGSAALAAVNTWLEQYRRHWEAAFGRFDDCWRK